MPLVLHIIILIKWAHLINSVKLLEYFQEVKCP